ncbi:zinc finger protein 37-like isoform X1 [Eurosta solidaginis]|uniref:zinc finger protein 37-like isoform X1 n=1 Tax=Eurosta solidaginis TaxID=178769 RepID=UPI0035317330
MKINLKDFVECLSSACKQHCRGQPCTPSSNMKAYNIDISNEQNTETEIKVEYSAEFITPDCKEFVTNLFEDPLQKPAHFSQNNYFVRTCERDITAVSNTEEHILKALNIETEIKVEDSVEFITPDCNQYFPNVSNNYFVKTCAEDLSPLLNANLAGNTVKVEEYITPNTITDYNQTTNVLVEPLRRAAVENCKQNAGTTNEPTARYDYTYATSYCYPLNQLQQRNLNSNITTVDSYPVLYTDFEANADNNNIIKTTTVKCLPLQPRQPQLRKSTIIQKNLQVYATNNCSSGSTSQKPQQICRINDDMLKISTKNVSPVLNINAKKNIDDSIIADASITCNKNNDVKSKTDDLSSTTENGIAKTQMAHENGNDTQVFYDFECMSTECASTLAKNYNNAYNADDENQSQEIMRKKTVDHINLSLTNKDANTTNICKNSKCYETERQRNVTAKSTATTTKSKLSLKKTKSQKQVLTSFSKNDKVYIIYTCNKCSLRFQHKSLFRIHMESKHSCHDLPAYTCAKCWQLFEDEHSLLAHITQDHPLLRLEFPCLLCERKCTSELDLAKHKAEDHFEKRKYDCKDCGKRFISRQFLNAHLTVHSPLSAPKALKKIPMQKLCKENKDQMPKNLRISKTKVLLRSLNKNGKVDILYTCPKCSLRYQHKSHFTIHMRNEHLCHDLPRYTCADCWKLFDHEDTLLAHINYDHPLTILEFPCLYCEDKFRSEDDLAKHKARYHFRKHVCKECGKCFINMEYLLKHSRLHYKQKHDSKELPVSVDHIISKNFACDRCDAAFADFSGLRTHRLINHSKKRT